MLLLFVHRGVCIQGFVFGGGLQPGGCASGGLPLAGWGDFAFRGSAPSRVCIQGIQNIHQQNVPAAGLHPGESAFRVGRPPSPTHRILSDMVNEQVARILLACILVNINNKKAFQSNDNLLAVDGTK